MMRLDGFNPRTLSDLMEQRAALRRQEILVAGALRDLARELRSWQRHRMARHAANRPVPAELERIWGELEQRQVELQLDLLQIRHAVQVTSQELDEALHWRRHRAPPRAG